MTRGISMAWQIPLTLISTRNHFVAHSATKCVRIIFYCHCKRPFLAPTSLELCPLLYYPSFFLWATYSGPLWKSRVLFLVGIRIKVLVLVPDPALPMLPLPQKRQRRTADYSLNRAKLSWIFDWVGYATRLVQSPVARVERAYHILARGVLTPPMSRTCWLAGLLRYWWT